MEKRSDSDLSVKFPSPRSQVNGHFRNVLSVLRDAFQALKSQPYCDNSLLVETEIEELVHHAFSVLLNSLGRHDCSVSHGSVDFRQGFQSIFWNQAGQIAYFRQVVDKTMWKRRLQF